MTSTMPAASPLPSMANHTAGIFADMSVDGPEIGTLVAIIDRAKNLPNRKTIGKQNPYCAARLGKEAKKTNTDVRGGQTPRWDQELRFTVHDSPDYYQLKVSCFNDDKKTDLIGETWLPLEDIIVPGGGRKDIWQSLNYRGRYAGDLRIELTYYDTRTKDPETERRHNKHKKRSKEKKIKRRPLPSDPTASSLNGSHAGLLTTQSRASNEYASLHMVNVASGGLKGPREIDAPREKDVVVETVEAVDANEADEDMDEEEMMLALLEEEKNTRQRRRHHHHGHHSERHRHHHNHRHSQPREYDSGSKSTDEALLPSRHHVDEEKYSHRHPRDTTHPARRSLRVEESDYPAYLPPSSSTVSARYAPLPPPPPPPQHHLPRGSQGQGIHGQEYFDDPYETQFSSRDGQYQYYNHNSNNNTNGPPPPPQTVYARQRQRQRRSYNFYSDDGGYEHSPIRRNNNPYDRADDEPVSAGLPLPAPPAHRSVGYSSYSGGGGSDSSPTRYDIRRPRSRSELPHPQYQHQQPQHAYRRSDNYLPYPAAPPSTSYQPVVTSAPSRNSLLPLAIPSPPQHHHQTRTSQPIPALSPYRHSAARSELALPTVLPTTTLSSSRPITPITPITPTAIDLPPALVPGGDNRPGSSRSDGGNAATMLRTAMGRSSVSPIRQGQGRKSPNVMTPVGHGAALRVSPRKPVSPAPSGMLRGPQGQTQTSVPPYYSSDNTAPATANVMSSSTAMVPVRTNGRRHTTSEVASYPDLRPGVNGSTIGGEKGAREISPIIGNDGRVIDPSEHLPTDTWAPEPERKPAKAANYTVRFQTGGRPDTALRPPSAIASRPTSRGIDDGSSGTGRYSWTQTHPSLDPRRQPQTYPLPRSAPSPVPVPLSPLRNRSPLPLAIPSPHHHHRPQSSLYDSRPQYATQESQQYPYRYSTSAPSPAYESTRPGAPIYAPTPRSPINASFYGPSGPPIPTTVPIQPGGVEDDDVDDGVLMLENQVRALELSGGVGGSLGVAGGRDRFVRGVYAGDVYQ